MMNKQQLLESQKECASMLGMTLQQYKEYLKNAKVHTDFLSQQTHKVEFLNHSKNQKNNLKLKEENVG